MKKWVKHKTDASGPNLSLGIFRKIIIYTYFLIYAEFIYFWVGGSHLYKSGDQWLGSRSGMKPLCSGLYVLHVLHILLFELVLLFIPLYTNRISMGIKILFLEIHPFTWLHQKTTTIYFTNRCSQGCSTYSVVIM